MIIERENASVNAIEKLTRILIANMKVQEDLRRDDKADRDAQKQQRLAEKIEEAKAKKAEEEKTED